MAYSEKEKEKIITKVCDRVANGEALRTILAEKNMIDKNTFYIWIDADPSKSEQYARSCAERAESMFEDILNIADNQEEDTIVVNGVEMVNHNSINRARLRVDARKWALSKLMPKKYGDKVDITTDGDAIKPAQINVSYNGKGINLSS